MTVQIRRASARFVEKVPGRATWHGFSFGQFYDPERTSFGAMVCHDEHLLGTGHGFTEHAHEGVDIVTYVVSGALAHTDSLGNSGVLQAGELGWLRSSTGVQHSEVAAAPATRFVQVWLQQYDGEPAWERVPLPHSSTPSASPASPPTYTETGPSLRLPGGDLQVLTLAAGQRASLSASAPVHLFVASGGLARNSLAEPLGAGDTMLLSPDAEANSGARPEIAAAMDSTVLVWTLPAFSTERPQEGN